MYPLLITLGTKGLINNKHLNFCKRGSRNFNKYKIPTIQNNYLKYNFVRKILTLGAAIANDKLNDKMIRCDLELIIRFHRVQLIKSFKRHCVIIKNTR